MSKGTKLKSAIKNSLYNNINKRKADGTSRPKSESTISNKSFANMKKGFPKNSNG